MGCTNTQSNVYVLKFAHYANTHDEAHKTSLFFKELVEEKTDNRVQVIVHSNYELGNAQSLLQSVRIGTIDLVLVGNPFFAFFAPEMSLLDHPFLFRDMEAVAKALDGEVGELLFESLTEHRIKGLAFWDIGFRNITNSVRPIQKASDLKGLKIRTTPNKVHLKTFSQLGANPSPLAFNELYLALRTGMIDGQENPVNQIYAYRFFEVQKYLSLTKHVYTAAPMVMNLPRFNSLDSVYQRAIVESARQAAVLSRELNKKAETEALMKLKQEGVQVEENPDISSFKQLIGPGVYRDYVASFGSDILDRVMKISDHD